MPRNTVELPVAPVAARLFVGYRAARFTVRPEDDQAVQDRKRADFFNELGTAFMPGTPVLLAPLGLAAYVPAVLDTPQGLGLPDEVAAIVYASRPVYDRFRETSLSRKIYTRSHVAVFDMDRSVAEFPSALNAPRVVERNGSVHHFTFLSLDARTDWQSGATRIVFVTPGSPGADFQADLLRRLGAAAPAAEGAGVGQVLMACADSFAAFWIHSEQPVPDALGRLDMLPKGARVVQDLETRPYVITDDESPGVPVADAMAITFRFERKLSLFHELAGA